MDVPGAAALPGGGSTLQNIVQTIRDTLSRTDWAELARGAYKKIKGAITTSLVLLIVGWLILLAFLIAILAIVVQVCVKPFLVFFSLRFVLILFYRSTTRYHNPPFPDR